MHREDAGLLLCPPAGRPVWRWFLELCRSRGKHTIVVSGMAGSQIIKEQAPVTWQEIAAWSRITGRNPSPWEAQQLAVMDTVYLNTVNAGQGMHRDDQGLGEYCGGKDLAACRKMIQNEELLKRVCGKCPN